VVDIGEYVLTRKANGIEITAPSGMTERMVFLDIKNLYQDTAEHVQGIHLDFQKGDFDATEVWAQIALGLPSFSGWQGR